MSKEMDALSDFAKAGKRFLDALKPDEAKEPGAWDAACNHPDAVLLKRSDLDAIIAVMDDEAVNKVIPGGLLRVLFPLRALHNQARRGSA